MLSLAFSLGSTSILFSSLYQPAVAVDLRVQNNNLNNLHQRRLLNVIEQFKTKLFPYLTTEKQSTFVHLPLLTTSETGFDPSVNTVLVDFAINSDGQANIISQLPPLTLAEASISSQPSWQIYTVKVGDTLSKIARQYDTSIKALLAINNIENPNYIPIGRELNIPQIEPAQALATETILSSDLSISEQTLEPLQQPDVSEPTPNLVGQSLTVASRILSIPVDSNFKPEATSNGVSNNPYITKLRADIKKLRDHYQNRIQSDRTNGRASSLQPTASMLNNNDFSVQDTSAFESPAKVEAKWLETSVEIKENLPVEKDFLSVAPVDTSNYQSVLPTKTETTATIIQPQLPPLSPPEEYLPNVFDGYNWPAQGTVTSGYGWRWGRLHKGIDIAAPIGTPILAAASGEVIFSGWHSGGYGNLIKIKHPDSSVTFYAHNNRNMVTKGQKISQGQQIAEMGSTGFSTGPHLHFEIRANGNSAVNPMAFLGKK